MTSLHERHTAQQTELDLVEQQLRAIDRFNAAKQVARAAAESAASSREMRMDAARRMAVIRRQQDALIARAHAQLLGTGVHPMTGLVATRAVLAHRNAWFRERVAAALTESGVHVIARAENGADAVGIAVAEQPDVILVEDGLEMMPADAVIREIRQYSPGSLIAAQVPYGDRMGPLLDAGAATVFVRQIPPVDVATALWQLVAPASA